MEQFLNSIPKPLLIAVAIIVGVVVIVGINPQYTKCHAQTEIFEKNLRQDLYGRQGQQMGFSPKLSGQISSCKQGNGPGGCFELFATLRKVLRELNKFPESCHEELAGKAEIRGAIETPMGLMVQVAWGEQPPEGPEQRYRWFEAADVALFCNLRETYIRLWGEEMFMAFRAGVQSTLPGEAPTFEKGLCTNCEFRKKASQLLTPDEIWKRSLFSSPCSRMVY